MSDEAGCLQREIQSMEQSSARMNEAQHQMEEELSAMRQYQELIIVQNVDLELELSEFVKTEEILKQGLNRR